MLYFITILTIFLFLSIAVIMLFKKITNFRQQGKNLKEKESEFIHKLVSEGKMKPDQAFYINDLIEGQITDGKKLKIKKADNDPGIYEVHPLIYQRIRGLTEERLKQLLNYLEKGKISEQRQYDRKDFYRIIDYTVNDRYYRDFIQDISEGGLFIETSNKFAEGQKILMTFLSPDYEKPFKVHGEIIHTHADGIGVRFKTESQVQKSVLKSFVNMIQN